LFYEVRARVAPTARLVVLIPAHNEAMLIARCARSLRSQTYPPDRYEVVVVADNCSDDTAAIAAAAGADVVMIRDEPDARGKGRALRWAMDRLLTGKTPADAVVVVDADSVADPDFLATLVAPFQAGAQAVQGESLLYGDGSPGTALRVVAFLLVNRVRPAGRCVLGLPATHLAGNGMLLSRELLLAKPWGAFSSAEDLEYSVDLQMDRVRIAFAGGAVLRSPTAPNARAAAQQQLRWEGGKAHLARTRIPQLFMAGVRQRHLALLGVAFDLAVPPLGFLAAIVAGGVMASGLLWLAGILPILALTPWLLAGIATALYVLVGMRAAGASRADYRALLRAPWFVVTKPLRARRVLSFRGDTWVRTERGSTPR
jgi:cellulose synthase/poly-beta-1,6-N-acetylglucosamine synthase-like glycosyltransferase